MYYHLGMQDNIRGIILLMHILGDTFNLLNLSFCRTVPTVMKHGELLCCSPSALAF